MTSDVLKGFVDYSLSKMSHDQLRNIILATSGGNYEEMGKAVLAEQGREEKGRKGKGVDREGHTGNDQEGRAGPLTGVEEYLGQGSQRKRQRE
jgi:hypothetical protein